MSKEGTPPPAPTGGSMGDDPGYPEWSLAIAAPGERDHEDELMRRAIRLARENSRHRGGGPFAAIIATASGHIVSLGCNEVVPRSDCTAHAEVLAIRRAGATVGQWKLDVIAGESVTLYTTCAPCILCTGAVHWSGITRVVAAARAADAETIGFREGPKGFRADAVLRQEGVEYVADVLREEALGVFKDYEGPVYSP